MSARIVVRAVLCVALGLRTPVAVIPAQVGLIVTPAKHRPSRGASRDRSLPGKARRAREEAGRMTVLLGVIALLCLPAVFTVLAGRFLNRKGPS